MSFDLETALERMLELGASDLHVKAGAFPRVRVDGELVELADTGEVASEDAARLVHRVLSSDVKRRDFEQRGSADCSYHTSVGRFRVSVFSQRSTASFVFRAIAAAPDPITLGLPATIADWADCKRGLVVVTGPTGSGKSTSCAAIIDRVNSTRRGHVLTIEDPIEFVHSDRASLVCQREVGTDAPTSQEALRAALRQDPDVILVGEIRDEETAMTALRAAETGHLVLCTMHTLNAAETVQRFVDMFGETRVGVARQMLAGTLVGISSQRLVPGAGGGRQLNAEILVNSSRVRDLIAEGAAQSELEAVMAQGEFYGMRTFDQDLIAHVREGSITRDTAVAYASAPHDFKLMLVASGVEEFGAIQVGA